MANAALPARASRFALPAADNGHALWIHKWAIHLLLAADVMFTSRVYRIANPFGQPILLGLMTCIVIFYTGLVFLRGYIAGIIISSLSLFFIFNQMFVFAKIASSEVLMNAAFQFISLSTCAVFYIAIRRGLADYVSRTFFIYAFSYTVLYVTISLLYSSGIFPKFLFQDLILKDVERGDRIFNYAGASVFAWFVCLHRTKTQPKLINFGCLAISALAIALTESRVFILVLVVLTIAYLNRLSMRFIGAISLIMLWATSLVFFYGMIDDRWNPFSAVSSDSSGGARASEYETARFILGKNLISGVGYPAAPRDTEVLTGNLYFAASDLGALGVWFDWGLFGLILFFIGSHIVARPPRGVGIDFKWPLFLTGCFLVGYGCIAPILFYPTGAMFFTFLLALWLASLSRADNPAKVRTVKLRPGKAAPSSGSDMRHGSR